MLSQRPTPPTPDYQGRISKMIIFETDLHTLPYSDKLSTVFDPVRRKYLSYVKAFHSNDTEKMFFIFFACNRSGNYPADWFDEPHNTWYIPVVNGITTPPLPTQWVQDMLVFSRTGRLGFSKLYASVRFREFVASKLRIPDYFILNPLLEGGNLQGGIWKGFSFLLTGRINSNSDKAETEKQLKQEVRALRYRYYGKCYTSEMDDLQKIFYHLDNYTMLVGPVDAANKGCVLLLQIFLDPVYLFKKEGTVVSAAPTSESKGDIVILPKIKLANGTNDTVPVEAIKVPVIVFPKPDPKITTKKIKQEAVINNNDDIDLVLSYTNGHIENYMKGGKRIIRFYLPDYSSAVKKHLAPFYSKNGEFKQKLGDGFKYYPRIYEKDIKPKYEYPDLMPDIVACKPGKEEACIDRIFEKLHNAIRENIKASIFEHNDNAQLKVIFIPHEYYQLARKSGSLHCMSKVLERDK